MNKNEPQSQPTKQTAIKILDLLKYGLCKGKGIPAPGKMCVEAAVCYALGLPHSDNPPCVSPAVRAFKITLNDSRWSSNETRAKGLRRIAIAQLGSNSIDEVLFVKELARLTIKIIVPIALRAAAKLHSQQNHKEALENVALICERDEDKAAAEAAADAAADAADAAADAAAQTADYAARAAARAAAEAACAADTAADATADAACAAACASQSAAAAAAYAAQSAVDAAQATVDATDAADEVLCATADAGVSALQLCESPGCQWLDLVV
jgi:hypothetical protein